MLRRFSAYGFLKNQRYHEPFFVLALVEQGLSFLELGLLIATREVVLNLLEIPSGVIADLFGRRRCMVASFMAYLCALVLFASAPGLALLYLAMVLYALGDAFRSGTHKAMIFAWLRAEGREADKAEVYGYTRSWSKRGTAIAALVGAVLAIGVGEFTLVFWFTLIPYVLNLANLASYPRWLDGSASARERGSLGQSLRAAGRGISSALRRRGLRRLLAESMAFRGSHELTRSYLQPLVETSVLALPIVALASGSLGEEPAAFRTTAITLGLVYFALGLIESAASRRAGALAKRHGELRATTRWLWRANALGYGLMLATLLAGFPIIAMLVFVVQTGVLNNLFRPVQLARFDAHTPAQLQATILSAESQAKALFVALLAPVVGLLMDHGVASGSPGLALWPLAALGLVLALIFSLLGPAPVAAQSQGK